MALLLAVILNLLGSATAYGECNPYWGKGCSVDGGWSAWDDWSACSAACAGGTQSRSRTCTSPKPEQGGAQCAGEEEEERACNTEPCKTEVLQFNGTHRDWVQVTTEVVGNSSNLSICTWFKLTDVSQNWNTFLEYKFAEYERIILYYIRYSIEDIPVLGFSVGGESQSIEANMEGKIVVDKWYHVCITQQPVEGPSIFLDGERVFTASAGIVTELEDFSYPLSGRLVAGQVSDSSTFVDAYKNNPGFTSDFSMKGELKDTFLATESISEEDVKILASKFSCMVESDSFTKLVSWSDLLAGKFNGDLVRADADCINTLPDP